MGICGTADESGLSNNSQAKLKADMCLQIAAGCEFLRLPDSTRLPLGAVVGAEMGQ